MKYYEFIQQVQNRAHLDSRQAAEKAIQAALAVLGQRLFGGEAEDLAAQLPAEIAGHLRQAEGSESFGREEFLNRVGSLEGVAPAEAESHARAVFSVLREAVSAGEIQDVRSQLPPELASLFEGEEKTLH